MKKVKSLSTYLPAWFLPGKHLQTIIPAIYWQASKINYYRERWITPDNDFIDLDWLLPYETIHSDHSDKALCVIFHGLEGNSNSHYARALMHAANRHNWQAVVVHFRSCSGELNQQARFYHAGDDNEINWVLNKLFNRYQKSLYVIGISLGGNALLCWLGKHNKTKVDNKINLTTIKENLNVNKAIVAAACTISVPYDLNICGPALDKGFNRIYTHMFLKSLKCKTLRKWKKFPGLFDRDKLLGIRSLYEFDNLITAPLHGFHDVHDYWQQASSKKYLTSIATPTLLINALNDPFVPASALPDYHEVSAAITLERPLTGGHAGFLTGPFWPLGNDMANVWLANRVCQFLSQYKY